MTQQLEIEFFFPLTEQITLDLDYTPCEEYAKQLREKQWANSITAINGSLLTAGGTGITTWAQTVPNSFAFKPDDDSVGYWELGTGFHFYNKKKPNWLHQKVVAMFMGLKWKDK